MADSDQTTNLSDGDRLWRRHNAIMRVWEEQVECKARQYYEQTLKPYLEQFYERAYKRAQAEETEPMDRSEALAELVSLPAVTRISVADLKPGDVLVLECEDGMSMEAAAQIKALIEGMFPEHKAIVLTERLKLRIVREQGTP